MLALNLSVCLVVGLLATVRSAAVEYKEPQIEVDTSKDVANLEEIKTSNVGGSMPDKDTEASGDGGSMPDKDMEASGDGGSMSDKDVSELKVSKNDKELPTSCDEKGESPITALADLVKELTEEIKVLKNTISNTCGVKTENNSDITEEVGEASNEDKGAKSEDSNDEESGATKEEPSMEDKVDNKDEEKDKPDEGKEDEATKCKDDASDVDEGATSEPEPSPEPTLPPPPETCPAPFQLLAESCYYIQTDPREWKSWGEAQSFCQQQAGTLAAPHRPNQLREYLNTYYSNVFWVGGRKDRGQWVWLNGNSLTDDDWKTGKPDKHPSKKCLQLDASSSYKGVNHFCGEKFSFICEHRQG